MSMARILRKTSTTISTTAGYEKTIFVKTWTGRTITVVFSPERPTRFMKKEIERKTGIPTDHQQLVAGGRVLMDNTSLKEIGLSDGRTIELTA